MRLLGTIIGVAIIMISSTWGIADYLALDQANQKLRESAVELPEREFRFVLSREEAHRINVGFEGTWLLMGVIVVVLSNQGKDRYNA